MLTRSSFLHSVWIHSFTQSRLNPVSYEIPKMESNCSLCSEDLHTLQEFESSSFLEYVCSKYSCGPNGRVSLAFCTHRYHLACFVKYIRSYVRVCLQSGTGHLERKRMICPATGCRQVINLPPCSTVFGGTGTANQSINIGGQLIWSRILFDVMFWSRI